MNLLDLMVKIGVDDQASSKIGGIGASITKGLGNAVKKVGAITAAGVAAAGAGAVAMTKAAVDSYAQYEQLAGGIGKLYGNAGMEIDEYAKSVGKAVDEVAADYERNEKAQKAMLENAKNAYRTAGMDANTYMSSVTGFSSALINSLGGDTEKAAEIADMAMQDISDNANTFGKYTVEELTGVYQALAKGQYQTLDNLNLGFGGTKEGLQQLLDKAKELSGVNYSADSFADIAQAIHVIQENAKIAGTTMREAMGTIEGSANMTKAAWDNLLIAIGAGDTEAISSAASGIVDGIFGAFIEETGRREGGIINNVLPVVQHVGDAIVAQIPQLAESIARNLIDVINNTFGTGFDAESIMTSIEGAFGTASERLGSVFDGLSAAWESFSSTFDTGYLTITLEALQGIAEQVWGFVEGSILPNMPAIGEAIGNVANFLGSLVSTIVTVMDNLLPFLPVVLGAVAGIKGFLALQAVIGFFTSLGGAVGSLVTIVGTFGGPIATIAAALGGWPVLLAGVVAAVVAFIATNEDAREFVLNAWNAIVEFFSGLPEWWSGVWESVTASVSKFTQDVALKWGELKDSAQRIWDGIKTAAVDAVKNLVTNVVGFFVNLANNARAAWDNVKLIVVEKALELASGAYNAFKDLVNNARETFENIKSTVTNAFNNAKTNVVNAATSMYNSVKSKFDGVMAFIRGIPSRISGALSGLGNLLYNAGSSIIGGLLSGLKAKFNEVKSWVSGVAGTIKSLKGPIPYDRTVLVDNGMALMNGLQKGLSVGYEREVAPYVSGIASSISSAMTLKANGGTTLNGGISIYLNYSANEDATQLVEDMARELALVM